MSLVSPVVSFPSAKRSTVRGPVAMAQAARVQAAHAVSNASHRLALLPTQRTSWGVSMRGCITNCNSVIGTGRGAFRVMEASAASSDDLLIIGPGVLGSYAGKLWIEGHPGCEVVGQTNTETSHGSMYDIRLRALGIDPVVKPAEGGPSYPNVLFSAPPSGSKDYVGEVEAALKRWSGEGSFVFTSSGSVFAVDDGGDVDESTPLVPIGKSDSTDRLLKSEAAVLKAGGCVARFVGLYHAHRGAHTFFLKKGQVERPGRYVVNLIHYEDAASLAVAVLSGQGGGPHRGEVFVGCDGVPVTFRDMMDAVEASDKFEGKCVFTMEEGPAGKHVSNEKTMETLAWHPKYASFVKFIESGATDFYTTSGLY